MLGRRLAALVLLAMATGLAVSPLLAQEPPAVSPILTIEPERLFLDSQFGKASIARLESEQAALLAENKRLEAALEAEEKSLTERRPSLSADEFRTLAEAFDKKAEEIRSARQAKSRSLNDLIEEDKRKFLDAAFPILGELMTELGALAILDKKTVFVSFERLDITDMAIARIDAAMQESQLPGPAPAPEPNTEPVPQP